ncbi:MAG: tRNA (guanosine(37)-N1)-methyltransferase TrmD [Candidatus Brocadiae bacterium]|nr:tRNA (guanosine(37)-N1)-methyltransferase TrmD [Candidatus Brocadiia bacterium]
MTVEILTLFPEMFPGMLSASILGLARQRGLLDVRLHNLRDWSADRHHKVDDRPYGGGPGMLLRPEPVFRAVEWLVEHGFSGRRLLLTPGGRTFDQGLARELAAAPRFLMLCGHYEGFDDRIRTGLPWEEVSIGDYVLSGGEPAALAILDAVTRLVPGALGDPESPVEESFTAGRLEYPQFTRPREFRGMAVPEVLLGGNHAEIARWREEQSRLRTERRRSQP